MTVVAKNVSFLYFWYNRISICFIEAHYVCRLVKSDDYNIHHELMTNDSQQELLQNLSRGKSGDIIITSFTVLLEALPSQLFSLLLFNNYTDTLFY